jgi:hypothetical protein
MNEDGHLKPKWFKVLEGEGAIETNESKIRGEFNRDRIAALTGTNILHSIAGL